MRALVIEGSDAISGMISALVTARGFDVRTASSGARGLDEALSWGPDVVLVDVVLDGPLDGIAVCERLREAPSTKEVPILVIAGADDDEVKRRAAQAGATAVFEKPFSPLALLKEIEAVTKR